MRAVLDSNVIVSAIARYAMAQTAPALTLRAGIDEKYILVLSEPILEEAVRALTKTYFGNRLDGQYTSDMLAKIRTAAVIEEPAENVLGIATHWQDDLVLATALSGDADYLVTGDKELLAVQHPFAFGIIHPSEFLAILNAAINEKG